MLESVPSAESSNVWTLILAAAAVVEQEIVDATLPSKS